MAETAEDASFTMTEAGWETFQQCLKETKSPPMPHGNWLFLGVCLRLVAGCLRDRTRQEHCWRLRALFCFYMSDGLLLPEKTANEELCFQCRWCVENTWEALLEFRDTYLGMLPLATERLRGLRARLLAVHEQSPQIWWLLEICDSMRQVTLALQMQDLAVMTRS